MTHSSFAVLGGPVEKHLISTALSLPEEMKLDLWI
jgi:hypothetical protein